MVAGLRDGLGGRRLEADPVVLGRWSTGSGPSFRREGAGQLREL
jgi:hypothetical protein